MEGPWPTWSWHGPTQAVEMRRRGQTPRAQHPNVRPYTCEGIIELVGDAAAQEGLEGACFTRLHRLVLLQLGACTRGLWPPYKRSSTAHPFREVCYGFPNITERIRRGLPKVTSTVDLGPPSLSTELLGRQIRGAEEEAYCLRLQLHCLALP